MHDNSLYHALNLGGAKAGICSTGSQQNGAAPLRLAKVPRTMKPTQFLMQRFDAQDAPSLRTIRQGEVLIFDAVSLSN